MTAPQDLLRRSYAADVTEAYDSLDALLSSLRKYAPELAGRVETARDLLFSVRVQLETEDDQ